MTKQKRSRRTRVGFIILAAAVVLALIAFVMIRAEIGGSGKTGETVTVTIAQGSGTADIASELKNAGLIHNASLFRLYSRQQGADGKYQYGDFELTRGSGYAELIEELTTTVSYKASVNITFPEGYNAFQMAKVLEEKGLCTADEFLKAADSADYDLDFIKDISTDKRKVILLEGFLFPDTYTFDKEATARDIVSVLLQNFQKKVLTDVNKAAMKEHGYSLDQMLALASLIQLEASGNDQMYNVSSVFTNRLAAGSTVKMLQSDTTTYGYLPNYVKPYYSGSIPADVENAYDTYSHEGLMVGAIANPGTGAIDAALHPTSTPYYYFVTDTEMHYYYAKTFEEHLQNIETAKAVNAAHGINGLQ